MDMWLSWLLRSRDLAPLDNLMSSITWNRSNLTGMTLPYPNDWFHERMESLWMMWVRLNPPPLVSSESQLSFAF